MTWSQVYDPLHSVVLSTALAALPILVLLGSLGVFRIKAQYAALLGLATSLIVAVAVFRMPVKMILTSAAYGGAYGLFPIGWIVLNVIFLYQLTNERGLFDVLRKSITGLTQDRRLQLLLVAFSFGAFFEGASGFGTPVAVTGAILIGLGFTPLAASGLSLIANTAPVAFGALGTPIIGLQTVTGLDLRALSAMVGRQLPFFSLIVPFWLIWAFAGFRGMLEVWPAILVAGVCFAVPQFLISNFHGPWLVDVVAAVVSLAALALFMKFWHPKRIWRLPGEGEKGEEIVLDKHRHTSKEILRALVAKPTAEAAIFNFNWMSATGSGIFIASIVAGLTMGYSLRELARVYWKTLKLVRFSLVTIAAMMAIGFTTRYSGMDATLGLAFARTGFLYPFFGTMLGWLGVALTGSDTSSNVLFGSLQKITATQIGINPTLMAAANSSGGVMGKMIDAQSIVVASTATRWYGHEGDILRYVFFHSLALAALVGILVLLQAYVFTSMIVK